MAFVNQETLEAYVAQRRGEMQAEVTRLDADVNEAAANAPWKAQVEATLVEHDARWQSTAAGLETLYQQAKAEIDSLKTG